MIQKLRMKLIGISMGSLVLVIAVLIGMINFFTYQDMVKGADGLLELLIQNDGSFPPPEKDTLPPQKSPSDFLQQRGLSPETPYETRFFTAFLDRDGTILSVDTGKVAAIDETEAESYVRKAFEKNREYGFAGQYRYHREENDDGYLIVFLDCNRQIASCRSVLFTSLGVACFGILLVFGMIFIFSGIVMRPVYESYEKQKRFITDAGHEIKTPLTIIDADIDVLGMEIGENEWLDDMRKQTERLSGLTNELIYLARMEEGEPGVQMIDLPFSDLIEEKAASFQALAIRENKSFTVKVEPMLMVCGDEKSLRKLVSILLDNAVKYSETDGEISLSAQRVGHFVRLTVYNTTQEIEKEGLEHLFERFYRADPSRNSQKSGYGIGLSVAKAIAKAHRGEIRAVSKDGHSLTITVTIPVKQR